MQLMQKHSLSHIPVASSNDKGHSDWYKYVEDSDKHQTKFERMVPKCSNLYHGESFWTHVVSEFQLELIHHVEFHSCQLFVCWLVA